MSDRKTDTVSTSQQPGNQALPVSRAPTNKNKIDVINLSSQLTSMELLSKRKAKKRVRFELPETDIRAASSQDFVSFQKDSHKKQKKVKQLTIYKGDRLPFDAGLVREEGSSGSATCEEPEAEKSLLKHLHPNVGDDNNQITPAKRSKSSMTDTFDGNNNCSNTTKQYLRRKMLLERRDLNRAKKRKSSVGLNKKLSKHKQTLFTKTVKELNIKGKGCCEKNKTYSLIAKKAKYTNVRKSVSKEKQKNNIMHKVQHNSKKSTLSKYSRKERKPSRQDLKRAKLKAKLRRKVSMAKSLKSKVLKRKLATQKRRKELTEKRIARKRAAMKKRLAEKRRRQRHLKGTKKQKVRQRIRKPKKPKFIPIQREEEVSNSMRVNLLIYRTFQKAADDHLHCCSRRCWKDWEELDMEDVYFDFE